MLPAPRPLPVRSAACAVALAVAGCSQGGTSPQTVVGEGLGTNPATGDAFVFESHQGGAASSLRIQNVFWGRLVEIYDCVDCQDADPSNDVRTLRFSDFVIGQDIATDLVDFVLDRNPITGQEQLTVRWPIESPEWSAAFARLEANLQPLLVKGLGIDVAPPFSAVPRNAAIVVRFDDLIDPATLGPATLPVRVGNPPTTPFEARLLYDPNHGGLADWNPAVPGPEFYSTRVIVDPTVSQLDAQQAALAINTLGLPAAPTPLQGNVVLRFPTVANPVVGQTQLIRNPSQHALAFVGNGPVDGDSLTGDVVRVFRSGLPADPNNGFLADDIAPSVLGAQTVSVTSLVPVAGTTDEFLVDATFQTAACAQAAAVGDVLRTASAFTEVTAVGTLSGAALGGVRVRVLSEDPSLFATGPAEFLAPFEPGVDAPDCFVRFNPPAGTLPSGDVSFAAEAIVQFSEPMDPASVLAFDTFRLRPQDTSGLSLVEQAVAATIESSADLREFRLKPSVPLSHQDGSAETYLVALDGAVTDLAGNAVDAGLGTVAFALAPHQGVANAESVDSGNVVLSFASADEDGDGLPEVTGNFLFDLGDPNGRLRPRDVQRFSAVVDSSQPIVAPMQVFALPIITPHVPLGSRMQTLWRTYDLGLSLLDPTTWDLDVEGVCWAPFGGSVQLDSFQHFEVLLTHSLYLPDEEIDQLNTASYPDSGVKQKFNENLLDPTEAPQVTVHPGSEGYLIQPLEVFPTSTGTPVLPWPMNEGKAVSDYVTYTWRDTSIQAVGGLKGGGVDIRRMIQLTGIGTKNVYPTDQVPSIGLPLLLEFRCKPDSQAFGLSGVQIALALNTSPRPFFRVFSSGGFDTTGSPQTVDPDVVQVGTGGYGPGGNKTKPNDNSLHFGQADFVVRVSRMHSAWFDTRAPGGATFGAVVVEPLDQPLGTGITVDFRGATAVNGAFGNANQIGAYGNSDGSAIDQSGAIAPTFLNDDPSWKSDVAAIDGAQFVQVRVTFASNVESLLGPSLSALGLSFVR